MQKINGWIFLAFVVAVFLSVHACRGVKSDSGVSSATSQPISQPASQPGQ